MLFRLLAVSLVTFLSAAESLSLTATWDNGANGGNRGRWATNGQRPNNWSPNQTPQSTDDVAIFSGAGWSGITLEQNLSVGELRFDSTAVGYSISGNRTLTFDVSSGSAGLNVTASDTRDHVLGMSLSLADDLVIDNQGSGSLTITGGLQGSTQSVSLVGGGNTILASTGSTYGGGTSLSGGTLTLGAGDLLPDLGAVSVAGGTLDVGTFSDTIGALNVQAGSILGSGTLTVQSLSIAPGGDSQIDVGIEFSDPSAGLTLDNSADQTLRVNRPLNHRGPTAVARGTLALRGSASLNQSNRIDIAAGATLDVSASDSGRLRLQNGQVLGGKGRVFGDVNVGRGALLSPGNSPGILTTGDLEWEAGGSLLLEVDDASSTAGVGWDLVDVEGALTISAVAGDEFVIDLASLLPGTNSSGEASGFPGPHSWTIVQTTMGITGFSADAFVLDTSGFLNPHSGGLFALGVEGDDLVLSYSVVPEPGTSTLLLLGLFLLGGTGRRN